MWYVGTNAVRSVRTCRVMRDDHNIILPVNNRRQCTTTLSLLFVFLFLFFSTRRQTYNNHSNVRLSASGLSEQSGISRLKWITYRFLEHPFVSHVPQSWRCKWQVNFLISTWKSNRTVIKIILRVSYLENCQYRETPQTINQIGRKKETYFLFCSISKTNVKAWATFSLSRTDNLQLDLTLIPLVELGTLGEPFRRISSCFSCF